MPLDNDQKLLNETTPTKRKSDTSQEGQLANVHPESERIIEEMFRRLLGNPELQLAASRRQAEEEAISEEEAPEIGEDVTVSPRLSEMDDAVTVSPRIAAKIAPAQSSTEKVFKISEAAIIKHEVAEPASKAEAQPVISTPAPEASTVSESPVLSRLEGLKLLGIVLLASLPILGVATILRLWDFSQQSAYMDEASYIVTGRMLLEQGKVYSNALQWTFGSFLYPILAGWLDQEGGLAMARGLSLVASLVTVLSTILLTLGLFKNIPKSQEQARADFVPFSKPVMASLIAGLLVAVLPTVIALSRFATYDAMAAGLFAAGCASFVWARRQVELAQQTGTKRTWLIIGLFVFAALCLFGAFLTKYVVALYFPALCLLVLSVKQERRFGLLSFIAPLTAACLAYYLLFSTDLSALLHFGGQYQALRSGDWFREYVLNRPELLLLLLVGYWGVRQAFRDGRISQALLLAGGGLLLIVFQLITRADYDYWKHSVYLIIMLAPLAGWLWSDWSWWDEPSQGPGRFQRWWMAYKERRATTPERAASLNKMERLISGDGNTERPGSYSLWFTLVVGLVIIGIFWSQPSAQALVKHWPSITPALNQIQSASKDASTVLVDDSALVYYLYNRVPTDNITTPFFNNYKGLSGVAAYQQAVNDQKYSLIILDGGATQEGKQIWDKVRPMIQASNAYELSYSLPLDSSNLSEKHDLEIYRLLSQDEQQDPNRPKKQVASPTSSNTATATPAATITATAAATTAAKTQAAKAPAATTAAPTATATAVAKATATPTPPPVYPANATYNFSNGDEGWGALPATGGLQPGMAVVADDTYQLGGHSSLKFTPQPASKVYTVGVNRTGEVKKVSMYVFVPADKAGGEVRIGLYYFDQKWGWHDDGFQTKLVPGQWTQLSLELPANQSIQGFGMKLVGFSGSVYLNGVTVE